MMATNSELKNIEETLPDNDPMLSRAIVNSNNATTTTTTAGPDAPNPVNGSLSPNYLVFETYGLSNGKASLSNSITDFTAYNSYIHHLTVGGGGGAGDIARTLGAAGINNVSAPAGGGTRVNVMSNIVLASNRFEVYNRSFRNYS
jgi:hypothetical protein